MTANSLIPFALIMAVSLAAVSRTDPGLSLVTTSAAAAIRSSVMINHPSELAGDLACGARLT
jgi:hypothetical protein